MESGQSSLSSFLADLACSDGPAFIRAAAETGSHAVWHIDAIVTPPAEPAGWQPLVWQYEPVTFIAGQAPCSALASALDPSDAQTLPLTGYNLTLPVVSEQLSWQHRPSRARYDSVLLPWPARIFEPRVPDRPHGQQQPPGYLIGDDCPSFPSYGAAFRAFFYGDFSLAPGGQVPSAFGVIRVVDGRAWLERVVITPTALDIYLAGSQVDGTRVELNGATYRADARASGSAMVRLPLPDGLPANAWLYLSRDRQWLDYRAIGEYSPADLARAGVEIELPEDPASEIQALLSRGEGLQVEFKRQLPEDTADSKRTVFKTVAAFANGHGGRIVFGVEKDEATVCGLDGIDLLAERDRLALLARSTVTPAPDVEVRAYELDGKALLVLTVQRGADPPYGITLPGKKDKPVEFYVRRDATTFPARPEEIRNAVLAAAPPPEPTRWRG